jgi:hypothetical protein
MTMGVFMDIGIADFWTFWCMHGCQDTTIICIYIALTYIISYEGILEWVRLILDLFSLPYCSLFVTTNLPIR